MSERERIVALDILRGIALFGMIIVHFHQTMELPATGTEDLVGWIVWIGVETKAWAAFAFLFGASFAIFLRRAEARGLNVVPLFVRRMIALGILGAVLQFGFGFAILLDYAVWGVVLLIVRKWPTRALLLLALAATLWTGAYAVIHLALSSLVLIILGFLAIRHGVLENPRAHVRLIAGVMIFGFVSWATWWLFLRDTNLESGFGIVRDQWLGLTYTGAVLLLLEYRPVWIERLESFRITGRTALSNYVLQVLFFWTLGKHLGVRIRPYYELPASIALFLILVLLSKFWLARHKYGPLERLWRSVTFWQFRESVNAA
jgi:uncharacterized membrane protein YeiB